MATNLQYVVLIAAISGIMKQSGAATPTCKPPTISVTATKATYYSCNISDTPNIIVSTWTDPDCCPTGSTSLSFNDLPMSNQTACRRDVTRIWTLTDGCGKNTSASQQVTVWKAPDYQAPPDKAINCTGAEANNLLVTGAPTAIGCTGNATLNYTDSGDGKTFIKRTWIAVDRCSNRTQQFYQTLYCCTPPSFNVTTLNATYYQCDLSSASNVTQPQIIEGSRSCCNGSINVTYTDAPISSNSCARVFQRTWSLRSSCGAVATAAQRITLVKPQNSYQLPPILYTNCSKSGNLSQPGSRAGRPVGIGCNAYNATYTDQAYGQAMNRTWTITEVCASPSTHVQRIVCCNGPSITKMTSVALRVCDHTSNVTVDPPAVIADQNCCGPNVTFGFSDTEIMINTCNKIIRRNWTAIDGCGAAITTTQMITLRKPRMSAKPPANVSLDCQYANDTSVAGYPIVTGCNPNIDVSYEDDNTGDARVITRAWTISDDCTDDPLRYNQIITCCSPPAIKIAEPNLTRESCSIPDVDPPKVVLDNHCCRDNHSLNFSDVITSSSNCTKEIIRTWILVDGCGRSVNATQKISIRIPKSAFLPPMNIQCVECANRTDPNVTGQPLITGCSPNVKIAYTDLVGSASISRNWVIFDQCANQNANFTQIISCYQPPLLNSSSATYTNCFLNSSLPDKYPEVRVDNSCCGTKYALNYTDVTVSTTDCSRHIQRVWKMTDGCGTSTNSTESIVVRKSSSTVVAPRDVTMDCQFAANTSLTGEPIISGCSPNVSSTYTDLADNETHIHRKWTVFDYCTNHTTMVDQTITCCRLPFITVAQNQTYSQCSLTDLPEDTPLTDTDTSCCNGTSDVSLTDDASWITSCTGEIRRTWRIVDGCNKSAETVQVVRIHKPPNRYRAPADITINCNSSETKNLSRTGRPKQSGCITDVSMEFQDHLDDEVKAINRTWTIVEACSNRTVYLYQTLNCCRLPSLNISVPNITLHQCDVTLVNLTSPSAVTNDSCCGGESHISFNDTTINTTASTRMLQRAWTVSDGCGNTAVGYQTVLVVRPPECETTTTTKATTHNQTSTWISTSPTHSGTSARIPSTAHEAATSSTEPTSSSEGARVTDSSTSTEADTTVHITTSNAVTAAVVVTTETGTPAATAVSTTLRRSTASAAEKAPSNTTSPTEMTTAATAERSPGIGIRATSLPSTTDRVTTVTDASSPAHSTTPPESNECCTCCHCPECAEDNSGANQAEDNPGDNVDNCGCEGPRESDSSSSSEDSNSSDDCDAEDGSDEPDSDHDCSQNEGGGPDGGCEEIPS